VIDKPLYGNPLSGGAMTRPADNQLQGDALVEQMQMRMTQRDQKTPAFLAFFKDVMNTKGYPTKTMEEYGGQFPNPLTERIVTQEDGMNLGSNVPLSMLNVTPPSVPVSEQTPFLEGVSQDIFGNPNIIRDSDGNPLPSLGPIQDNNAFPIGFGSGDSRDITSTLPTLQFPEGTGPLSPVSRAVTPIVSGPETFEIATQQAPMDSYNRVGQQLTGPNQDDILGTLKNIEQGIASLGQGGMNQSSFGGFNNNFGIGSFFPPYGGMYG
jgi:hypothetical protein